MKEVYFFGPMSLGDAFVFSGYAYYLLENNVKLHIPVVPWTYDTLSSLYKEEKNVKVVKIHKFPEDETEYIKNNNLIQLARLPIYGCEVNGHHTSPLWDMQVYHFLQLPYSFRYKYFKLPKENTSSKELYNSLVLKNEYYILTATGQGGIESSSIALEETRKQYNLPTDIKIICIDNLSVNMMDYIDLIINANEIHCVPSSFYCLVENIHKTVKGKLFFHSNRANTLMNVSNIWNHYRWNIINYVRKL